jgi:hypothetical protein
MEKYQKKDAKKDTKKDTKKALEKILLKYRSDAAKRKATLKAKERELFPNRFTAKKTQPLPKPLPKKYDDLVDLRLIDEFDASSPPLKPRRKKTPSKERDERDIRLAEFYEEPDKRRYKVPSHFKGEMSQSTMDELERSNSNRSSGKRRTRKGGRRR